MRRNRTLLAVLVLVSLVLLTVDYRQGDGGSVAAVQRGALAVVGPVQEGFARAVRPIGGFFSSIGDLWRLRQENAELLAELEQLRDGRVSVAHLQQENTELRAQLAMRERLGFTTTGAQVIAQPPGAFDWTVLIDIGSDHGVQAGMAVIDGHGLVGKVIEATRRNARVELLASPNANYAVRVADSGEDGLLRGRGSRPFQLEILDPEAEIEPGAEAVTRAFRGTTIPDGIPLGVGGGPLGRAGAGGARYLAVRPYVDFARLNIVQVVLDGPDYPADLPPDEVVDPPEPSRPPPPPPPEPEPPPDPDAEPDEPDPDA
jgi:rod shape-determining protein MreC